MTPRTRLIATTAAALVALAGLATAHPRPAGPPTAWSGGDTAAVAAWALAVATATWLAIVAGVCAIALRTRRTRLARAAAARAPRFVRHAVEIALAGTCAIASAAGAAPTSTMAPATRVDVPVVRDRRAMSRPAPTRPAPTTTTPTAPAPDRPEPPIAPPAAVRPADEPIVRGEPARRRAEAPPSSAPRPPARTHVVAVGENLWVIARAALVARGNPAPDEVAIARYWHRVVADNRPTLRSGDPSLIYPGEMVVLPDAG
jgi:hypothetical protein